MYKLYAVEDRTPRVYPWMNIKTAHSVYYLHYHIVWVCKYRRRILNPGICGYIRKILPKLLRSMPGVKLETIGFDKDHLHMVMSIPPRYSIASVMGQLKSQSSSQFRKSFPRLAKVYWNENILWSSGYFVSSVGVDEETIIKYVELQGRQDSGQLQLKL
jgi:putative transposase